MTPTETEQVQRLYDALSSEVIEERAGSLWCGICRQDVGADGLQHPPECPLHQPHINGETDAPAPQSITTPEADSYAAWQQKRGMLADKVDWAINEYDEFMKDDAYDSQRVLDRIIAGLRETSEALREGERS